MLKVIGANWFKLRLEDSGTITYRKHWFVLWQQIWQPTVLIFLIGLGMLARLITLARTPGQRLFDLSQDAARSIRRCWCCPIAADPASSCGGSINTLTGATTSSR